MFFFYQLFHKMFYLINKIFTFFDIISFTKILALFNFNLKLEMKTKNFLSLIFFFLYSLGHLWHRQFTLHFMGTF